MGRDGIEPSTSGLKDAHGPLHGSKLHTGPQAKSLIFESIDAAAPCVKECAMVPRRVGQCTEFALRDQPIFAPDMHLVGTDSAQFRALSVTSRLLSRQKFRMASPTDQRARARIHDSPRGNRTRARFEIPLMQGT
jgi:hypothetical protein